VGPVLRGTPVLVHKEVLEAPADYTSQREKHDFAKDVNGDNSLCAVDRGSLLGVFIFL
jgi:hypothetical protein